MLFAIQGLGGPDLGLIWILLTLYLFHPASIMFIFLASFKKLPSGPPTKFATVVIALNVLLLLSTVTRSSRYSLGSPGDCDPVSGSLKPRPDQFVDWRLAQKERIEHVPWPLLVDGEYPDPIKETGNQIVI